MTVTDLVLAAQAVSSSAMCGLIWFVQVVHYPLFAGIEGPGSPSYAVENQSRTAWVVIPFMLVEGLTAGLIAWAPPNGVPRWLAVLGFAIVVVIWLSTAAVQMPLHSRLAEDGHSFETVRALVRTNWVRTLLWTLRAGVATWMLLAAS